MNTPTIQTLSEKLEALRQQCIKELGFDPQAPPSPRVLLMGKYIDTAFELRRAKSELEFSTDPVRPISK